MAERDYADMDAEALRLLVQQQDRTIATQVQTIETRDTENAALVQTVAAQERTIAALEWVRALALLCLEEERRPRGAACSASLRRVGPHPHDRL